MDYKVEKTFEGYAVGDVVRLNPRQAKYLLLSGHVASAGKYAPTVGADLSAQEATHAIKGGKQ